MGRHDDDAFSLLERRVEIPASVPAHEIENRPTRQERDPQEIDPDGGEVAERGTPQTAAFGGACQRRSTGEVVLDRMAASAIQHAAHVSHHVRDHDRQPARQEPQHERAARNELRLDRRDRHGHNRCRRS